MEEYQLTTVTYGTASAPFQATRTLRKLADDNSNRYPESSSRLEKNFFVDDYTDSFPSPSEAINGSTEMSNLAALGGFQLRKWASNLSSLNDELTKSSETSAKCHLGSAKR